MRSLRKFCVPLGCLVVLKVQYAVLRSACRTVFRLEVLDRPLVVVTDGFLLLLLLLLYRRASCEPSLFLSPRNVKGCSKRRKG